ncbi:MAG: hypothetical protein IKR43_03910, partial [Lachnospiraceae bacterium]|nr:hypothetical protein [Lachnospiraceae bacterium]
AQIARKAGEEDLTLRQACLALSFMTADEFDSVFHPEEMT